MLQVHGWREIPDETKRVAHAAFPNGNLVIKMRDELGTLYADEQFQPITSRHRSGLIGESRAIERAK